MVENKQKKELQITKNCMYTLRYDWFRNNSFTGSGYGLTHRMKDMNALTSQFVKI